MQLDLQVNKNDYKISKVVKYDGSISFTLTPKKRNCKGCGKSFESNVKPVRRIKWELPEDTS